MARTKGSKNLVPFDARTRIDSTSSQEILHLSSAEEQKPYDEFESLIRHQRNFLNWLDRRQEQLRAAQKKAAKNKRGPKDSTFRKYRWYAEQQTVLEAVNSFEVFYKQTFVSLATSIGALIPVERIRGQVDAKVLWTARGKVKTPALIFEHLLFHDLDQVDKTSNMLIEKRRYNINNPKKEDVEKIKSLRAIFQMRHTLSHNNGRITQNDKAKFQLVGYSASLGEVIDPTGNSLGEAVRRLLVDEAKSYTDWILLGTADYLEQISSKSGLELTYTLRQRIEKRIGRHKSLDRIAWTAPRKP